VEPKSAVSDSGEDGSDVRRLVADLAMCEPQDHQTQVRPVEVNAEAVQALLGEWLREPGGGCDWKEAPL
jgi:hypothetical protein